VSLKLVTAPLVEPVSLDEMKSHLRVDIEDHNDLISGLIAGAREYLEGATNRAFVSQTWRLSLDNFPAGEIELPKPPLLTVDSIVYLDSEGVETTIDSSDYIVDTDSEPGRIVLASGASWPTGVSLYPVNPVQIEFTAGYGDAGSDVPQYLRQAVKLLVSHWYENPEATKEGSALREIPFGVESLIFLHRVY
jgi:uncharacterized phiE125 gp8 family phage protein